MSSAIDMVIECARHQDGHGKNASPMDPCVDCGAKTRPGAKGVPSRCGSCRIRIELEGEAIARAHLARS